MGIRADQTNRRESESRVSIKYILRKDGGDIIGCDNCNSEVKTAKFDNYNKKEWLCKFCAGMTDIKQNYNRNLARCFNLLEKKKTQNKEKV